MTRTDEREETLPSSSYRSTPAEGGRMYPILLSTELDPCAGIFRSLGSKIAKSHHDAFKHGKKDEIFKVNELHGV